MDKTYYRGSLEWSCVDINLNFNDISVKSGDDCILYEFPILVLVNISELYLNPHFFLGIDWFKLETTDKVGWYCFDIL